MSVLSFRWWDKVYMNPRPPCSRSIRNLYIVAYDDKDSFRVVEQVFGLREARKTQRAFAYGCKIFKLVDVEGQSCGKRNKSKRRKP